MKLAAVYASNAGDDATKEPYRVRLLTGFAEGTDQLRPRPRRRPGGSRRSFRRAGRL